MAITQDIHRLQDGQMPLFTTQHGGMQQHRALICRQPAGDMGGMA
jgi:hypothetical protein